jgi:nitrogen regulatory protein PII
MMKRVEILINEGIADRLLKALKLTGQNELVVWPVNASLQDTGIELQGRTGTYHLDYLNYYCIVMVIPDQSLKNIKALLQSICQEAEGSATAKLYVSTIEESITFNLFTSYGKALTNSL